MSNQQTEQDVKETLKKMTDFYKDRLEYSRVRAEYEQNLATISRAQYEAAAYTIKIAELSNPKPDESNSNNKEETSN